MRATLLCVGLLTACGSHVPEQPSDRGAQNVAHRTPATPDYTTPSDGPPLWVHTPQSVLCVVASRTETSAGSGGDTVPGCGDWPERSLALDYVQQHSWCGPCGFFLDAAASNAERATRPDACCYRVQSPPEPFNGGPPPPPAPPS